MMCLTFSYSDPANYEQLVCVHLFQATNLLQHEESEFQGTLPSILHLSEPRFLYIKHDNDKLTFQSGHEVSGDKNAYYKSVSMNHKEPTSVRFSHCTYVETFSVGARETIVCQIVKYSCPQNVYILLRSDTDFSFITQACKIHLARYLDLRSENIKCPEESTGRNFLYIGLGNYLLANTSKAQATKTKQNKQVDHVKLKRFCTTKEIIKNKNKN